MGYISNLKLQGIIKQVVLNNKLSINVAELAFEIDYRLLYYKGVDGYPCHLYVPRGCLKEVFIAIY